MIRTPRSVPAALLLLAAAVALPAAARAKSPWRTPVRFAVTNDAGVGYSWFVVGSHPDLGNWDVLRAAPLAWHDGNVWSADIGIQAGTELPSTDTTGYKFVKRPTDAALWPDSANTEWWPDDNLSLSVPAEPDAPYAGKRIVFLCDWPEPVELWYSMLDSPDFESTNDWQVAAMTKTADGRYELSGVGEPGEWMRFTFRQTTSNWWYHFRPSDDEETDFWTPLDAFCVRDAQVFSYEPVPTAEGYVSASRIVSTNVGSSYPAIAGRDIRIYLPRGYDENTGRRYPVVYFSDGQNIFSDQHSSADAWGVDVAADREIRAGHMREAILVGVPCRETAPDGFGDDFAWAGRLWEYLPSTDTLMGTSLRGLGANYAKFLIDNVKYTLDWNFRTLSDRANTAHVGSSAGGLLSYFLGASTNVFGLVGAVSGVYNEEYIPEFRQWCQANPDALSAVNRIWLDTGTQETNIDGLNLYASNWDALTLLLYSGHVSNKSLHFGVYNGEFGQHNEYAWAARSADILDFLLPVADDFNPLLPRELSLTPDGAVAAPLYPGETNVLVHLTALVPPAATNEIPLPSTDRPWSTATCAPTNSGFYFLRSAPAP